jgi:lysozyme
MRKFLSFFGIHALAMISLTPPLTVNGNINSIYSKRDSIDTSAINQTRLAGIDVSRYQYDIDWYKIKDIDFVFMKATEGTKISDPTFKQNWDSSKKIGIIRGAYHFYRPYVSPSDQFKHFSKRVVLESGDLPPVLDLEVRSKYPQRMASDIKRWLVLAENHYGVKPIIYCTHSYRRTYLRDSFFSKYPYWIANYAIKELDSLTSNWNFWQYTAKGRVEGIKYLVDKNHFKGTRLELLSLCKR